MVNSRMLLALLASTITAVSAAPAATTTSSVPIPSGAAGVNFIPEAGPGCEMSENPHSTVQPEVYNLTSSTGCITPSYAFSSYIEMGNPTAVNGPCAVSIFSEANCTGTVVAATLTTFEDCITGSNAAGRSINMACGP